VTVPPRTVRSEARDATLIITLDRPEARNAVNAALAHALADALDHLDDNPALRVGVIHGTGRGFCAGMDLKAYIAGESVHVPGRGFAGIAERSARKPLIAAIEGFAVAGGLEIALACDLIVAAHDARLGLPEVKRGLAAAAGGLIRLPRRAPYHFAMELALTGNLVSAERAERAGIVSRLTEPGQALAMALELAADIARNAPLAVDASKRIIQAQSSWEADEVWDRQAEIVTPVFASTDAREGALAFAEKRPPVWRGH
jgi:enoyl-CoA hydratase/carnithine racemase